MADDHIVRTAVLQERLEGHEKVCAERYGEIKESFGRVHTRLDDLVGGIRSVLIALLLAALGGLAFFVAPFFMRGG